MPEDKKKRRRRGRKERDIEAEQGGREKSAFGKAKSFPEEEDEVEADEFSFFDEPEVPAVRSSEEEPEEEEIERRPGKRHRPRRGSHKAKKAAESAGEKLPPSKTFDKFDDEEVEEPWEEDELESHPKGYSRRSSSAKQSEGRVSRDIRPAFRSIPTWNDAIGLMVAKNMESRGKGQNRGKNQNQGRGGRRENRR